MGALQKKVLSFYIYSIAGREEHEIKPFFLQHKKSHIGVIWKMFQEQPEAAARFNCNFMKNFNFLHGKTFEWVAQKKRDENEKEFVELEKKMIKFSFSFFAFTFFIHST